MREIEIDRGDRVLRVRDAGDPDGPVVIYFPGTPDSRLDLGFGEHIAGEQGLRLVTFDRRVVTRCSGSLARPNDHPVVTKFL